MLVGPRIEVKAVESLTLGADGNHRDPGPHLAVEAVLVHAEISRSIPETEQSGYEARAIRARALLPRWSQLEIELRAVSSDQLCRPTGGFRRRVLTHAT